MNIVTILEARTVWFLHSQEWRYFQLAKSVYDMAFHDETFSVSLYGALAL